MTTLMSRAVARGYKQARRVNSTSITITRGLDSVDLSVIPGETAYESERDGEAIYNFNSRDFLILASEFILDGSVTTPQRGDVVTEGSTTFQSLGRGSDQNWEYTDPTKTVIRLRTKER